MALRDILDRQAGTIEYVLHTHGMRAQVDGGKLSPRLAHFHLVLPPGMRTSQLTPLVPEMADALGVVSCRLSHTDVGLYLEVPRPDPVPVRLLPLVQRVADVVPPLTASLGLDSDGTPLLLRLNSAEVDPVLVSGDYASGKSSLLRGMALSLALHNSPDSLRLLLLDCTGEANTFRGLEGLPHLGCPVATGAVDALVSLRWALRALARRTNAAMSNELTFDDFDTEDDEPLFEYNALQAEEPELVVLIDGADALFSTANKRSSAEAAQAIRRLTMAGSAHGIHIVVAAEHAEELVDMSTSWGARIVGKVGSPDMARLLTGVKGSGAQGLLGAGDFLITLNTELIRFQAAAVSHAEIARAVDLIRSCTDNYPEPNIEETFPTGKERTISPPRAINRGWTGE